MALMGQVASQVLQRMQISGSMRCWRANLLEGSALTRTPRSVEANVFEIGRLAVDADRGGGNPVRELARFDHSAHERSDERAIVGRRQPLVFARLPLGRR